MAARDEAGRVQPGGNEPSPETASRGRALPDQGRVSVAPGIGDGRVDSGRPAGRSIRALLSRSSIETNSCDFTAVVHAVLPVVRRQLLQSDVVLETALRPSLPAVVGAPVQLQQVVLNLILNVNDASRDVEPARRRITVRTFVVQSDAEASVVRRHAFARPGGDHYDAADATLATRSVADSDERPRTLESAALALKNG
ncbi:MAG TPA: hypothetical protein VL242_21650 [Sorangium sp.]|nr:hypothetical protein [Sorangium sp.]